MLLHGEQYWLMGYMLMVGGAVVAAYKKGTKLPGLVLLGLFGSIVAFYGWLFQVGRFG
jgi:hypothetical protein